MFKKLGPGLMTLIKTSGYNKIPRNTSELSNFVKTISESCFDFLHATTLCQSNSSLNGVQCELRFLCRKCRFRITILLFDVPNTKEFKKNADVKMMYGLLCRVWPMAVESLKKQIVEATNLKPILTRHLDDTNVKLAVEIESQQNFHENRLAIQENEYFVINTEWKNQLEPDLTPTILPNLTYQCTDIMRFLNSYLKNVSDLKDFLRNRDTPSAPHVYTFYRCGLIQINKIKNEKPEIAHNFHGWSDKSKGLWDEHSDGTSSETESGWKKAWNYDDSKGTWEPGLNEDRLYDNLRVDRSIIKTKEPKALMQIEQNFIKNLTLMATNYFKDHRDFFVKLFANLIKYCIPELDSELCEQVSESIYSTGHFVLPWIQVLSSYSKGFYYYPPCGLYKRSNSSVFQFFTEWYGPNVGQQFFELYSNCRTILEKYTIIELALVHLRMTCWFVVNLALEKYLLNVKSNKSARALNSDLLVLVAKCVLDRMDRALDDLGMCQNVRILQTVLIIDAKRLNVIRFRFTALNCVEVTTMPHNSGLMCCNVNCSYCTKGVGNK